MFHECLDTLNSELNYFQKSTLRTVTVNCMCSMFFFPAHDFARLLDIISAPTFSPLVCVAGSDFKSHCGSLSYLAPEVFRDSSTSGE